MIVAAETSLDSGVGCKDIDYLLMVPEEAVFRVGCFGEQREMADHHYFFIPAFCAVKFIFQPYLLAKAHGSAVVVFFRLREEVCKGLTVFRSFRFILY